MLCKGRVKLTMASPSGKIVIVRVVEAGELLGLHAAISGGPHEVTAETLQPCQVDFIRRDDFMKLLHEHGDASINAMQQFTKYYRGACHQIRYLGLTPSATEKMACFLLELAVHGQETSKGIRFNLTLTHEEIAQVVGVTRETVTRALTAGKMLISAGPSVLIEMAGARSDGGGLSRGRRWVKWLSCNGPFASPKSQRTVSICACNCQRH